MSVVVERLEPDDWARLRDVRLRALRDTPDAFWATLDEEAGLTPSQWRDRLRGEGQVTLVARLDGFDAGMTVGVPHDADGRDARVVGVWVDPAARGRAVGDALIGEAVRWARERGRQRLVLEVGDANLPAQRLYRRLGFQPTGGTSALPPPREHLTEHELALWL